LLSFRYGNFNIIYPESYFQFLKEVFILDVYRTNLIRKNDLVLDIGASTGDFCILASMKVGENGKVIAIEPDIESYELLKLNIERNNCQNVIPVNSGVGDAQGKKNIIAPCDIMIPSKINTLENILNDLKIKDRINFIKMDIEGMETDVINSSIEIIKRVDVISLEFHGTKEKVDELLVPHSLMFKPITMIYLYKKMIKNLFLHPITLCDVFVHTIRENPSRLYKTITGFDMTKDHLLVGSYIKRT